MKLADVEVICMENNIRDTLDYFRNLGRMNNMNCICVMCNGDGPDYLTKICDECDHEFYPDEDENTCQECLDKVN
jgi:hypothetical protein